jgi:hypothetical protein
MRCPECGHENPLDYRFCGSCGRPRAASAALLTPAAAGATRAQPSPAPGLTAYVAPPPAETSFAGQEAPSTGQELPSRDSRGPDRNVTRYLCAAVNMNEGIARSAIEDVLEEQHRAIAITPGADLVTILKYAVRANRRRVFRDVSLFMILCGIVVVLIFRGRIPLSPLLLLLLLVAAWLTVFIFHYVRLFGAVARGLRPGKFDITRAPEPGNDLFASRQLARIAEAGRGGNVTVYSDFPPFVGYGNVKDKDSWSFTIDITRERRDMEPQPFTVHELYDHVRDRLAELDLPGIAVSYRLFVNGKDIYHDRRFLPKPDGRPVTQVDEGLLRQLMTAPEERARPYLTVGLTGWQGDLIVTTFVRFLLSRTDLFIEAAHAAVPPLRAEYRTVDNLGPTPTGGEFFQLVWISAKDTIPRLFGSVPGVFHALGDASRRDRKQQDVDEATNFGSLLNIREAAADVRWQRYFQVFDQQRYTKVIEARMFRALVEFLDDHGVDTRELVAREENITNYNTVIDNASGSQIAIGKGARVTAKISQIRGKHAASGGGKS